jgi:transcriptional regulator with XRE-family HTH domain
MGKYPRQKQKRRGEKLAQIREGLGWSQSEMLQELGIAEDYDRSIINNYEKNRREPPLFILLEYARLSGVCLDEIVDDEADLPKTLPAKRAHHASTKSTRKSRK